MEVSLEDKNTDRDNSQDRELENKDLGTECMKRKHLIYSHR